MKEVDRMIGMKRWRAIAICIGLAALLLSVHPVLAQEQQKLTASGAGARDRFGASISLSGDTAVVGAPSDAGGDFPWGSAYVFVWNGTTWTEQDKLAGGSRAGDAFGFSVSLSGETVVIGSPGNSTGGRVAGLSYVYVRSGTSWNFEAKLIRDDPEAWDVFGRSVALSGDTAVVGAPHDDDDGDSSGSAYVFLRSGTTWSQQAKLLAGGDGYHDVFGSSVSISGDTVLVGAPRDDIVGFDSGSAYVFVRSGTTWTPQEKLTAIDAAGGSEFGSSVSISGDTAVIGAPRNFHGGPSPGAAYVFVRSGTTWSQEDKLIASDPGGNGFGRSVSIGGDRALVGALTLSAFGFGSGSAYVFVRSGTTWSQQGKFKASDSASADHLGRSVSLGGDTAMVGASGDSHAGFESGSAYVFEVAPPNTPVGTDVVVQPRDPATGKTPVTVTFPEVTGAGVTSLRILTDCAEPDALLFSLGSQELCFELWTTATFIGPVEVCVKFEPDEFADPQNVRLVKKKTGLYREEQEPSPNSDPKNGLVCALLDSFSEFALAEAIDLDRDGLPNVDEADFGTDPNNPDSDSDGLLDGAEVDMAMGTGCPDPIVFDSDGDTISDGAEVDLGTNPCSGDTDGDGVPDQIDPDPVTPGEMKDVLQEATRRLADSVEGFDLDLFVAPKESARKGRRRSLANRLRNASKAIGEGDKESALDLLMNVLQKIDGETPPRDWILDSLAKDDLAADVGLLIGLLGS